MSKQLDVYSPTQAAGLLTGQLVHWYCEDGLIQRCYNTAGWKSTLMVVNTIGHLAEVAWHHPDLQVTYNKVLVQLVTHSEKGITDMDIELANKIEEVVLWQPGLETGGLTGTPDNDRHRYLVYKDQ